MLCPYCNSKINPGARFCSRCGKPQPGTGAGNGAGVGTGIGAGTGVGSQGGQRGQSSQRGQRVQNQGTPSWNPSEVRNPGRDANNRAGRNTGRSTGNTDRYAHQGNHHSRPQQPTPLVPILIGVGILFLLIVTVTVAALVGKAKDKDLETRAALAQETTSTYYADSDSHTSETETSRDSEAESRESADQLRKEEAEKLLSELKAIQPAGMTSQDQAKLSDYASRMETMIAQGEYQNLDALEMEWRSYANNIGAKKTGYQVNVMQYDFNEFPKIRLYLDVRDTSGNVVKQLAPSMFYVSEKDAANGNFTSKTIEKAVLMDGNERLNINLLADVSGSMSNYGKMESAKNIMKNFLNTVQFNSGDQVKLTAFSSMIDKSGYFTNDLASLNSIISQYSAYGGTKLYDTIIYGVQDVSAQDGAKCVIAFTDGFDEGSSHTINEVVDVVSRYKIPVFIVRIGDDSSTEIDNALRSIAESSGGSYKSLQEFSSDMSSFYNQIYRQMKDYYVVEYRADNTNNVMAQKDINVYVQNDSFGGEASISVKPGSELFDSLLGAYLRSYIEDMNAHHYDHLREYVDDTLDPNDEWSIQWQMKKQVTGGFSNVTAETLMDYYITDVTILDENTVHLKTSENYDVIYDEIYGEVKQSERSIAEGARQYLQTHGQGMNLNDSSRLRIWAKVNQKPEYILKRGSDGAWRFSKYTGELGLNSTRNVYDVEVGY